MLTPAVSSLPAELNDDSVRLQTVADVEDVFGGQRLEEENVRGVVVGRNRFRIRVDHDRLDAQFLQSERGLAAAVVELDALPDPVRAAAKNHDAFVFLRRRLVFLLVGRVVIRCVSFELGGAGINLLEGCLDASRLAVRANFALGRAPPEGELPIREAVLLGSPEKLIGAVGQASRRDHFFFDVDNGAHLPEEPRIDCSQLLNVLDRHS